MSTLQDRLRRQLEQHVDRIALSSRSGVSLTYRDLDVLTHALAHHLRLTCGVQAGDVVALRMNRSVLMVLTQLALLRLGAASAPLDLASPELRQQCMLDSIGGKLVLTDSPPTQAVSGGAVQVDLSDWLHTHEGAAAHPRSPPLWVPLPDATPLCLMFTSGSTGNPKGVMVPSQGVNRLARSSDLLGLDSTQRWAMLASPAFDASILELWLPLLHGACLVVQDDPLPSLEVLASFLVEQRISHCLLTTSLFNAMVEDQPQALSGLRCLLIGGERASVQHVGMFLKMSPEVVLLNAYGPTENSVVTTLHRITTEDLTGVRGIPIGRPIQQTMVRVEPVADVDEPLGELWVGGAGVAYGYWQLSEQSAEKFVDVDGARWYRTGDLVEPLIDGTLLYVGRADRQVKLQGHRIELDEVELRLAACPGISDAVAFVRGESAETQQLVAVYTCQEGWSVSADQLRSHLKAHLAAGAMPRQLTMLTHLPKMANGKVDRLALRQQLDTSLAPVSLLARLRDMFASHAGATAIEAGKHTLSYRELDERSGRLARHLRSVGVGPGDLVPLALPRSMELIVAMVAVLRCGAAYVPIDLRSPPARKRLILDRLHPRLMFCQEDDESLWMDGCTRIDLRTFDWSSSAPEPCVDQDAGAGPLYVMFTSGSTGEPKGVMVSAANVAALLLGNDWADFPADARWLQATSPAFDISGVEIWGALLHGACLIVLEGELPSLDDMATLLVQRRISHAQLSTALFNALVDTHVSALGGIRQFITGGERASPPHMRRLLLAHPSICLINGYGPTETTIYSLTHRVSLADTHDSSGVPIGRVVRGTQLRIEPIDASEDATAGGELWIGGLGVSMGYLGDTGQTSQRFVHQEGQRWYRSGDLVQQRDDGVVLYLGRADRQVKLQSQRIELDEVELALAACAGVGEVAVFMRGQGTDDRHLVAAYSGLAGALPPEPDLVAAHASAILPQAAVPKIWVPLPRLPININGKVDRAVLSAQVDQTPDALVHGDADEPALKGSMEEALAGIWQVVLPQALIHRRSHFLRIGGTSLLALRVSALIGQQLGREFSPLDVLRFPVLADQAQLLSRAAWILRDPAPSPSSTGSRSPVELTRMQEALLSAQRIDQTGAPYLVQVPLLMDAPLSRVPWRDAFKQLADRHPLLRLRASSTPTGWDAWTEDGLADGWWRSHERAIAAPADLKWPQELLSVINRPMDTVAGGVMRVDAWPILDGGSLVVWTVHHAVVDEEAVSRALAELDVLLQGQALPPVHGRAALLPEIERQWTDMGALQQVAKNLADSMGAHRPPIPKPPLPGAEVEFEMPPSLSLALEGACRRWGCSPFPVLMSAYGHALQEVFGQAFRFVATPFSRRLDPELVEPLAYWVDVSLIEAGARAGESVSQSLSRVMNETIQAQSRRFQHLHLLAEMLSPDHPEVAAGLTQFGFTWRLAPARTLTLGGIRSELMRVPQTSARFGLCLHVAELADGLACSIEAVNDVHDQGLSKAVWLAFLRHLTSLTHPDLKPHPFEAEDVGVAEDMDGTCPYGYVLRQVWASRLSVSPEHITGSSQFYQDGGSSLTAMRMSADLHRQHGLLVDLPAFLRRPTYANLCRVVTPDITRPSIEHCVFMGPPSAARVCLMIPGIGGHAVGLFQLGREAQYLLPGDTSVAIVDLDGLLAQAPDNDVLNWCLRKMSDLIQQIGLERVTCLAGFSLGGLLSIELARRLGLGERLPVCLLDTYAPRVGHSHLLRRLESKIARTLWPPQQDKVEALVTPEGSQASRTSFETWGCLERDLSRLDCLSPLTPVHFVQATRTVAKVGLIWRRASSGFNPKGYASWRRTRIQCEHLDLPRAKAKEAAQAMILTFI